MWLRATGLKLSPQGRVAEMRQFYGTTLSSRLMLGTAQYPSPAILSDAFRRSDASVATVSVRREAGRGGEGQDFWDGGVSFGA